MKRLFPDTLLTRFILVVVTSVVIANLLAAISFKLVASNVFDAMRRASQIEAGAGTLALAAEQESAESFAEKLSADAAVFRVFVSDTPMVSESDSSQAEILRKLGAVALPGSIVSFRSSLSNLKPGPDGMRPGPGPGPGDGFGSGNRPDFAPGGPASGPKQDPAARSGPPQRAGETFGRRLQPPRLLSLSVEFPDGKWANLVVSPANDRGPPIQPFIFVLSLSMIAVAIAAAFAARWLYSPLHTLTRASQALGQGERHSPLPVSGPRDVRNMMQAFNTMAARMEATLQSQKDVLVAIGHDLRTPLTAMRIRTAMIEDAAEREKMERALDELQSLTEAALQAGRTSLRTDEKHLTDLGALVESLCEDLADIRMPVSAEEHDGRILVPAWPEDLTRALRNIIVNAVEYGERARVRLQSGNGIARVIIEDDGPGIPETHMASVFDPLVRVEASRSTETGGHGLGLHIARNIVLAHDGSIELANRPLGGLTVTVTLPAA